jgi:hypothetical protein
VQIVRASASYGRAIAATADLLAKLRIEFAFVGNVARSAWLGTEVEAGSLDLLAVMSAEQKNHVAMMGSNRGFRVDREEIEQSEELDLVPLNFDDIRVHVLVATNALYARMVKAAVPAGEIRVVRAEDLALLMSVGGEDIDSLTRLPEFNRNAYNQRMVSIGLPDMVVPE